MKYKEIVKNKEINAYLEKGNANLGQLGFTDHSQAHCVQVAHQAGKILERFGYSEHEVELVKIAGYMHDIGNAINRTHHARVRGTSRKRSAKGYRYVSGRPDYGDVGNREP